MTSRLNTEHGNPEGADNSTLIVRLERYQKDVDLLRKKLNAYYSEPQTYELFEKVERLKRGLSLLNEMGKKVLIAIREHKNATQDDIKRMTEHNAAFKTLKIEIRKYLLLTREA